MKRYLAFFGSRYYPSGGMDDFLGDFEYPQDATHAVTAKSKENYPDDMWRFDWGHVWDSELRTIIWKDGIPT